MSDRPVPLVSIVTISYQHEAFIARALDSFLEQSVDFPIEVVVADDASPDGTQDVIRAYAERHPEVMRPVLRERNVGVQANLVDALSRARGRYIALCEGDDYWTDPSKLARQVEHLERHPEASVSFHLVEVVDEVDGTTSVFPPEARREDLSLESLLRDNFIQTNSVVYRRLDDYDGIPPGLMPLDWYFHVLHALHGEIHLIPRVMSVYRRHQGGLWYQSPDQHAAFWTRHGPSHAALCDALLDLVGDDPVRTEALGGLAARTMHEVGQLPYDQGVLAETVRRHPRVASLALHRAATTLQDALLREQDLARRLGDADIHLGHARAEVTALTERVARQAARVERQRERIEAQRERVLERDEQIARLDRLLVGPRARGIARRVLRRG